MDLKTNTYKHTYCSYGDTRIPSHYHSMFSRWNFEFAMICPYSIGMERTSKRNAIVRQWLLTQDDTRCICIHSRCRISPQQVFSRTLPSRQGTVHHDFLPLQLLLRQHRHKAQKRWKALKSELLSIPMLHCKWCRKTQPIFQQPKVKDPKC